MGCADRRHRVLANDAWLADVLGRYDAVALGELHDAQRQHAARVQWLRALAPDQRIALVMEHFDVDQQAAIERGQHERLEARDLAQAAGFRFDGWPWALLEPVVTLALERKWPLVAANLSARQTMQIARGGVLSGLPAWLGSDIPQVTFTQAELRGQIEAIDQGHCGLMPQSMLPAMRAAQQARDAVMAMAVAAAQARFNLPVVFLGGNGHVRSDWGMPRFLKAIRPRLRIHAVGLLEGEESAPPQPFDRVVRFETQERPDPCESLRKQFGPKR
jgi:uncharacterized iron-regulated protein